MASKVTCALAAFCLAIFFLEVKSSFIKPNNVPRVGRSSEADWPFDQNMLGYVIKTIPSKNIPRMGRRNYDAANHFDIPKLHQGEGSESYNEDEFAKLTEEQEDYFGNH